MKQEGNQASQKVTFVSTVVMSSDLLSVSDWSLFGKTTKYNFNK